MPEQAPRSGVPPLCGSEGVFYAAQVDMKKRHAAEEERLKTCWSTLLKYVGNVAQARARGF